MNTGLVYMLLTFVLDSGPVHLDRIRADDLIRVNDTSANICKCDKAGNLIVHAESFDKASGWSAVVIKCNQLNRYTVIDEQVLGGLK